VLFLLPALALAADDLSWQQPPDPIPAMLDAADPPSIRLSPDNAWMLELTRPASPSIADLARPEIAVAGFKLDPQTFGPARDRGWTGASLRVLGPGTSTPIALPKGTRIDEVRFSPDSQRLAIITLTDDGRALWVADVTDPGHPRQLTGPVLHAVYGAPCDWLPADQGLLCKFKPEGSRPVPQASAVPTGPLVEESRGRTAPARTYTNLLQNPHDEALFEYFLGARLDHVALDGARTPVLPTSLLAGVSPSPDGRYALVSTLERPYSYQVPASRFPRRTVAIDLQSGASTELSVLPLADAIPIAHGSTRDGRRSVWWRADAPATAVWVEALDGGDGAAEAEHRDAVYALAAPFTGQPTELWRTETRYGGIVWGRQDLALGYEYWHPTRTVRTWRLDPASPGSPTLLHERSAQDAYADPGDPLTEVGPWGRSVLRLTSDGGELWLAGSGASPDGVYPFLDRLDLETGGSTRVWQAADPYHESVVDVLDDDARTFVTRRQSETEPPNYALRTQGKRKLVPLTDFTDPKPQLAGLQKEVITYERADGVTLSATLYTPPGYDARKDGPLPTVLWAYPREYKDAADASQVTSPQNTFSRPGGISALFLVTQGYAVLAGPKMPIIGEGDAEPNDAYVEQLVAGARAAVDAVVALGVADPERMAIGGHSYGAFTTANLLAHTDLFRAGIARSGAYNRTLTPFGFQGEQRSFWEATDTYMAMSPFTVADRIDEPLLLLHGGSDTNSGTYPIQSERLYDAIKGLGGTVRWVVLPLEEHGYVSREAMGHTLWEMVTWLDEHVKNAPPRADAP
jgi:dipeptidyl aminopeptidase/acylaminoacyl peptidase